MNRENKNIAKTVMRGDLYYADLSPVVGSEQGGIRPVLVIQNGVTKLVNVKNQDAITKVIDMAPDFINKFMGGKPAVSEETVQAAKDTAAAYDTGKTERVDL